MSLFSKDMDPKTIATASLSSITDSLPVNGVETNFTDAMKEMVSLEGQYIRILQRIQKILIEPFKSKEPRVLSAEVRLLSLSFLTQTTSFIYLDY